MHAETETLTPEQAQQVLEHHNPRNRRIDKRRVQAYAEAMRRGEWKLTGQGIIFDLGGNLLNGQHRLMACVEANVPLVTLVVRGASPDTLDAIDTGKARSLADNLTIQGERNAKVLAQALGWLNRLLLGEFGHSEATRMTHAQGLALLQREPGLREVIPPICTKGVRAVVPNPAMFAAFWYVLRTRQDQKGTALVPAFVEGALEGVALERGDPRLVLRDKWLRVKAERAVGSDHRKNAAIHVLAYNVRAWNAYYSGRSVGRLLLPRGAETVNDLVPPVRGWRGCPWR
jgi:hypothetical protein